MLLTPEEFKEKYGFDRPVPEALVRKPKALECLSEKDNKSSC